MRFSVIDTATGEYPDLWKIALEEEWAKDLCFCDMEGFAIEEDGTIILLDECGQHEYCPPDRFEILPYIETRADQIRNMSDDEIANWFINYFDRCPPHRKKIFDKRCQSNKENCKDCWLEWLQQPAEDTTP